MNRDEYGNETELACGITRTSRTVKTPMPSGEGDDSGNYSNEENHIWCYHGDGEYFKVSKITDNGWSVCRYTIEDGEEILLRRVGYGLNAQAAQRLALTTVVERT